jgi:hypothetical protein
MARLVATIWVVGFGLALVGCSSREASVDDGAGGADAGSAGASQTAGKSAGGASTGSAGKSSGGASTAGAASGCAYAKDDPEIVEPPRAIATRFVLLYDPALDDPNKVAAWSDFTAECGSSAVSPEGITGRPAWGECIAQRYVEKVNQSFAELFGSTSPFLKFESFTATPAPEIARGLDKDAVTQATKSLSENDKLNVFVVQHITNAGGVADLSQAYPSRFSGLGVAVEATLPWAGMAHELGHAIGFPHTSGFEVPATADYPCCGVEPVATTYSPMCNEPVTNIMCTGNGTTFDTCEHGLFLKRIAACWFSGSGGISCGDDACAVRPDYAKPPLAWCQVDGEQLSCACAQGNRTYAAIDCKDAYAKNAAGCTPGPACDVFDSACADGQGCYPALGQPSECLPSGAVAVGGSCVQKNDCAPGGVCRDGKCGLICDYNSTDAATKCPEPCATLVGWSDHIWVCVP